MGARRCAVMDGSAVPHQPTRKLLIIEMKRLALVIGLFGRVGAGIAIGIAGVARQSGIGPVRIGKRKER